MPTTTNPAPRAPVRLLRLPEIESMTGLKRTSIYNFMGSKAFPVPVRIGARAVAWRESDVLAWIAGRTEARCNQEIKK